MVDLQPRLVVLSIIAPVDAFRNPSLRNLAYTGAAPTAEAQTTATASAIARSRFT
jgi:hypothetical protein